MTRLPFFLLAPLLLTACPDQSIQAINANPEATITSPEEGEEVFEGFLTMVRGTVSDPDHQTEDLLATWYLGTDEVCPATAPAWDGETTCEVAIGVDETTLRLEVIDPIGAAGSDSIQVNVVATDAPEATITSPEPSGVYYSDQLIVFEGTVSDSEDVATDLLATWESSLEGALDVDAEPNAEGYISGTAYLQEGEHAIELTVVDSTAKTGSDTIVIDVGPPNSDPTCEILAPESGSVGEEGELVLFEAQVDDVDVDADWLTVTWESDKDGELGGSTPYSSGEVQFSHADLSVDTHTVTMTVSDEVGATCTHGVVYTVGTAPEVTVTSPTSGDVVNEGESVSFVAEISDNEDSPTDLTVDWTSSIDGTISTAGADSTGSVAFNSSSLGFGGHDITLTVTDTDGLFATELISLTVNALPTAPTVTISPDPAYADDDLVASASGSTDDDGDTVTYSYAWYEDGTLLTSATTATLSSSLTSDGSLYRVVATPNDGAADGPTGEAELEVSNSVPSITSVTISPSSPTVTDTLTCSYSGYSDADGDADASTYEWTVEGTTVGTSSTLAGVFIAGNIVACTVTPDDGKDTGTPVDDTATIVNTPPQVTSVALTPSEAYTNDTLTATVTTSDDDADAVTVSYAWYVDGTLVAETGSSLSGATHFDKGQDVYVEATPNDGTDDGAAVASGTVTVLNSPPEAPTVSISPADPASTDDLLCEVDVAASDDDGDSVTYTMAWSVDGASLSSTSTTAWPDDTIAAAGVSPGEIWTCTVTPNDGADDGDTATASVTVSCDGDVDGYTAVECGGDDCEDEDATAYPGSHSTEVPYDGMDQDCDGDDFCTDLNCDGWADIFVCNYNDDTTYNLDSYVYWGSSSGYSSSDRTGVPTVGANDVEVEDLDGDGYLDIVITNYFDGDRENPSYIYWGSASGYSDTDRDEILTPGANGLTVADVDEDGWFEIIISSYYYGGWATESHIWWGSVSGYSDSDRTALPTYGGRDSAVADFDGDGWNDIVFSNRLNGSAYDIDSYIYWGSASGFSTSDRTDIPTVGASLVWAGDLDSDGWPDIIFSNNYNGTTVAIDSYIYWGSTSGFSVSDRTELPTQAAHKIIVADLDSDGWLDLAFGNGQADTTYDVDSYIYWGSTAGYSSTDRSELGTTGAFGGDVGDLDEDGWLDLVFGNHSDGSTHQIDSIFFWGSSSGYSDSDTTALPSLGATGVAVVPTAKE
jgi:hypothetical protein